MLTLSLVLLVQHTTGSYGVAGALAAVTGVSMALFAPLTGRLADRHGQRAILVPGVLVHTLAGLSLTALALADAPLWKLFAATLAALRSRLVPRPAGPSHVASVTAFRRQWTERQE